MKPTSQISRPARRGDSTYSFARKSPKSIATDWSYQTSTQNAGGGAASFRGGELRPASGPSFRALSDRFFANEAKRESRLEGALFVIITALAAWPLFLAAQAAMALVK